MKWLLVDASWIGYRAQYAMGTLSHDAEPTGVIFGCLEALRQLATDRQLCSHNIAMFFDSKKSVRRELFSGYKQRRREDKTPEEWATHQMVKTQLKRLRQEILPDIGFPCHMQSGVESDDLIAKTAKDFPMLEFVIITSDGDLYQCIRSNVHWYDPSRKLYLDPAEFWRIHNVHPEQWNTVKTICGCKTDEVPGIKGIGELSAIRWVNGTLKSTSSKFISISNGIKSKKDWRLTRELVCLPHPATRSIDLKVPTYHPDKFFKWCERLGMKSYINGPRRRLWDAFFEGKLSLEARQDARRPGEAREPGR